MESDLQEVLILGQEIGDLDIEDETDEQQAANGLREIQRMSKKINRKGRETARSFREAANILDELWKATNKGRAVGTSVSIVGGLLTIGGGVATVMTAGAASPLLLLGMGAGFTGAGVNLVASYVEASVNSVQIKKAENDLMETVDYVKKMESTFQLWLERHSGLDLCSFAGRLFPSLVTGCAYFQQLAAKTGAEAVAKVGGTQAPKAGVEAVAKVGGTQAPKAGAEAVAKVGTQAPKAGVEAVAKVGGTQAPKAGVEAVAKVGTQAPKAGVEAVAKVGTQAVDDVAQAATKAGAQGVDDIAQASAKAGAKAGKVAGGVIIGVSAFFLAWDLYELHCTITDLVKNKGSDAAKFLRAKADELEQICSYL